MAKNKKKKAPKVEDFQKKKSRVGKKLAPADNATDTAFKARTIQLPNQLQQTGEPTNQRRQNLKDLMGQVSHYSSSIRQEALHGLKDLFVQHPHILQNHMGQVIEKTMNKITDTDAAVRQSCLTLVTFIFKNSPSEQLSPYFPLVVAHLSCAMTHIYDDIQLDSLRLLDIFLDNFPSLVAANASKLLNNFVGLMAQQNKGRSKASCGKSVGNLAVNPKGKLSTQSSRLKVLQRLNALLQALTSTRLNEDESLNSDAESKVCKNIFTFSKNKPTYVPVIEYLKTTHSSEFTLPSSNLIVNSTEGNNVFTSKTELRDFTELVFPLLLECWVESQPAHIGTGLDGAHSLETMCVIVQILCLLCEGMQRLNLEMTDEGLAPQWISKKFLKDFANYFLVHFPFQNDGHFEGRKSKGSRKRENKSNNYNSNLMSLNLGICEIVSAFGEQLSECDKGTSWIMKTVGFVRDSLWIGTSTDGLSVEQLKRLLSIIKQLFREKLVINQESSDDKDSWQGLLLSSVYKLYERSHLLSATKKCLLEFFSDLQLDDEFTALRIELRDSDVLSSWLGSLPSLLVQLKVSCSSSSLRVIRILIKALIQGHDLKESMHDYLVEFFEPLHGSFTALDEKVQHASLELVFRLQNIGEKLMQMLAACCQHDKVLLDTKQYLLQVIHQRSPCCYCDFGQPGFSLSLYLSFLFSVLIGYRRDQLAQIQMNHLDTTSLPQTYQILFNHSVLGGTNEYTKEHEEFVKAVCYCYSSAINSSKMFDYMKTPLQEFLSQYKVLPVPVTYSILHTVQYLHQLSCKPEVSTESDTFLRSIGQLSASILIFCCTEQEETDQKLELQANAVKEQLFEVSAQAFQTMPHLLSETLKAIDKDYCDKEARVLIQIVLKVLQHPDLKLHLPGSRNILTKLKEKAMNSSIIKQDILQASLKYEFSLFIQDANHMNSGRSQPQLSTDQSCQ